MSSKCCAISISKYRAYLQLVARGKDTSTFDFGCRKNIRDYETATCDDPDHKNQVETYGASAGAEYGVIARQADEENGMTFPIHAQQARRIVLIAVGDNIIARRAEQIEEQMRAVVLNDAVPPPASMEIEYGFEPEVEAVEGVEPYEGCTE
jgi:hypothetical protein